MKGKMVPSNNVVGGTITEISYWGPITVMGLDEREYEIVIEIGHDGPEHNVYESRKSIAMRAAATRRRNRNTSRKRPRRDR